MSFVQRELDRIHGALTSQPSPEHYAELYAAQQALVWVLDPATFKAPYHMLAICTQGDSEDCPAGSDHSAFLDNRADHVG
jgi:hypothetical protein